MAFIPSLDGVPNEIKREICLYVELGTLKAIRYINKAFRDIGAETLLSEVHVLFTIESIERLRDISLHPVIGRRITSLVYEADRLDHYESKVQWRKFNSRKVVNDRTLQKQWVRYRELENMQDELQERELDYREIERAVMRMPKLEKIQISTGQGLFPFTPYYHRVFDPGNTLSQGDILLKEYEPPGFRQMMSVIAAYFNEEKHDMKKLKARGIPVPSGIESVSNVSRLKTLHIGFVGWMLFMSLNLGVQQAIACELVAVEDLKLQLATSVNNTDQKGAEIEMCEPHLRKTGCIEALLTSAPFLRKLHIEFDTSYPMHGRGGIPTDLQYVVGDYTWEHLEEVTFISFQATTKRLIAFLDRHKKVLKKIRLRNMTVGRGDTWSELIDQMKAVTTYDYASIEGDLTCSRAVWLRTLEGDDPDYPNPSYWEIRDYLEGRRKDPPTLHGW